MGPGMWWVWVSVGSSVGLTRDFSANECIITPMYTRTLRLQINNRISMGIISHCGAIWCMAAPSSTLGVGFPLSRTRLQTINALVQVSYQRRFRPSGKAVIAEAAARLCVRALPSHFPWSNLKCVSLSLACLALLTQRSFRWIMSSPSCIRGPHVNNTHSLKDVHKYKLF